MPRQIAGHKPNGGAHDDDGTYAAPTFYRQNPPPHNADRSSLAAGATLEFSRFRVLLRQRQLDADGVPVVLGTRWQTL